MFLFCKLNVERNDCQRGIAVFCRALFLSQRKLQQWVNGTNKVDVRLCSDFRFNGFEHTSQLCFRPDKVDKGKEMIGIEDFADVRTHLFGKLSEYADNLFAFLILQFAYLVVGFHHLGRLYEDRLSRCTLVVYNTRNLAFHARSHWNNQASVAHGRCYVAVYHALALCRIQNMGQRARYAALHTSQFSADLEQVWRCRIAHFAEFIDDLADALHQDWERCHAIGKRIKGRVGALYFSIWQRFART